MTLRVAGTPVPNHRGATRKSEVTDELRRALEGGAVSRTHIEQMSFDMGRLLAGMIPELAGRAAEFDGHGFIGRMRAGSRIVWDHFGMDLFSLAPTWESDTMRGWAAFAVVHAADTIEEGVLLARTFASDHHFAVREWAWLGVRPLIVADVPAALDALTPWTRADDALIRRFACEATRPRGVWSAHLVELKRDPTPALPLLTPLVTDEDRYVQDSVANWLNDAAHTRPDWVLPHVQAWMREHGARVRYVARRALRSAGGLPPDLVRPGGAEEGPEGRV